MAGLSSTASAWQAHLISSVNPMNKNLRFGCVASLVLAFAAQLACGSSADPGTSCASAAECPSGQACNAGVCSAPPTGSAGVGTA
ncbi:MAG TPA: hypothetical protein VEQ58_24025, partial [Polyangiaceae bacterium]|nr:hypothetical protein [Polyangiaceae bacterium]